VIVFRWSQKLVADRALQHPVSAARLGPHANYLIPRLTARAGKVPGMVGVHARTMH